jgi:UDP-N-acetylmuramyl pentapeptide synthase
LRFTRIQSRASETDSVSFDEFCANEEREMSSKDPCKQNLAACMAAADVSLTNEGTLEELYEALSMQLSLEG